MSDNVIDLKIEPLSSNATPDMAVDVMPNVADQEIQTTVIANGDVNNSGNNNNNQHHHNTNNANSNSNGVFCKGVVASPPVNNHIHDHGDSISNHNHVHSNGNHTQVPCNVSRSTSHNHTNSSTVNGHGQGHVTSPVSHGHGEFGHAAATSPTGSAMHNTGPCYQPVESKSAYLLKCGKVMTDDQFETLRRQISVYSTICSQLVEMHKALMAQQSLLPNMMLMGQQQLPYDPVLGGRSSGRQRWTPSQVQLQILENLFEKSNGTPSKQKIKEITAQLGQHGSISETNVYNWFQNRKARAKRKQQHKDGESEVEPEDGDSVRKDKRAAVDMLRGRPGSGTFGLDVDGLARAGSGSFNVDVRFGTTPPNATNHMFDNSDASQGMHMRPQVDASNLFDQSGLMQRKNRDFATIVVFIDGKPWEVPSTTLDLKGSFGEGLALLDSQQQIVPTDENGFTSCPLHSGENYTLIKFNNGI